MVFVLKFVTRVHAPSVYQISQHTQSVRDIPRDQAVVAIPVALTTLPEDRLPCL